MTYGGVCLQITVRPEKENEHAQILEIVQLAFRRIDESQFVNRLRNGKDYVSSLSLVAEYENKIIGQVLFYPIKISLNGKKVQSLYLACVAVHPSFQRKGIGSRLVEEGLKIGKTLGFKSIIVIGYPEYYPRFGFEKASKWGIKTAQTVPDEALLAKELVTDGLKECAGTIEFPQEFGDCV